MVRDVETIRGRVQSCALRCGSRRITAALRELVPRGLCADASLRKAFPFKLLRLGVALVKIFARQLVCLSCALAWSEKLPFMLRCDHPRPCLIRHDALSPLLGAGSGRRGSSSLEQQDAGIGSMRAVQDVSSNVQVSFRGGFGLESKTFGGRMGARMGKGLEL